MAKRKAFKAFPGQSESRRALNCIGSLLFEAMYLDGNLDLTVTTRKLPDGSMVISVLHPGGTVQFAVSDEERRKEAARLQGNTGS